jgi:hypothetical protein
MLFLIVAVLVAAFVAGLIVIGRRSQAVVTDPAALTDRQIEATIDLTRRIMNRSRAGSAAWARAAAAHKASIDEQLRRRGEQPYDNIELIPPPPA